MHKEKWKTLRVILYQEPFSLPVPIEADLLCRQDNEISFKEVTYVQEAFSSSSLNTAAGANYSNKPSYMWEIR